MFNNSSDGTVVETKSRCLTPVVILERMEANGGKIKVLETAVAE